MAAHIDRNKVGWSFHRQATEYDRHASVQKRVVNRLVSLVKNHVAGVPASVLDIGCGTGQLLSTLREQFPDSRLYGLDLACNMIQSASERLGSDALFVNADAEYLPFANRSFDLLVSTSTLQWLDSLDLFFQQALRVTRANGLLCAAFFGGQTLCELRECFRAVVEQRTGSSSSSFVDRLHLFKDRTDVEHALEQIDFDRVTIMSEIETEFYSDVHDLLRSIKRIGAGALGQVDRSGGLGWRGILNETSRLYCARYGSNEKIPATYEVMYVVARCRSTI